MPAQPIVPEKSGKTGSSRKPSLLIGFIGAAGLLGIFGLASFAIMSCATLGGKLTVEEKNAYAASPNFDASRGRFVNLPEPARDSFYAANRERLRAGINTSFNGPRPGFKLPLVKPDFGAFTAGDSGLKVIWMGHSALALRMDSSLILLDPVFGRASPLPFYEGNRFQPPPFTREQLPKVNFIVISHEHYDHLERETVEHYAAKDTKFLVPLGISSHLRHWGVKRENIVELDWWESVTLNGVEFTATPAWHSSGRRKRITNYTQWASWVIRSANHSVYFTGDTGYGKHFRMIGDRFGPFDVVFLENGQYSRAWRSHMLPEQWPMAMRDLKSTNWFSMHWGAFSLAPHDWDDPIVAADSLARKHGFKLITPKIGEVVDLKNLPEFTRWWEKPASTR